MAAVEWSGFRHVWFEEKVTLPFSGTVCKNAITTGDVDNDGEYELAVGSFQGNLIVYKGSRPRWQSKDLGCISCLTTGRLRTDAKNSLVVLTEKGICQVFDFPANHYGDDIDCAEVSPSTVFHALPVNISKISLVDLDGDGLNELVTATAEGEICFYRVLLTQNTPVIDFMLIKSFQVGECTALSYNVDAHDKVRVVVGQPGGSFVSITPQGKITKYTDFKTGSRTPIEVAGHVVRKRVSGSSVVLAAADGTIAELKEGTFRWKINVGHDIMAISAVDLTGEGNDDIVACSWEGMMFIIDYKGTVATFGKGNTAVSNFTAGLYTHNGHTALALFQIPLTKNITMYPNAKYSPFPRFDLLGRVRKSVEAEVKANRLLGEYLADKPRLNPAELVAFSLYNPALSLQQLEKKLRNEVEAQSKVRHRIGVFRPMP